jgi:ATP-dependent DNA helicase RecG
MTSASIPAPKAQLDRLKKLGLFTLSDLVLHLPLRYEDETRLTPLMDARPGEQVQVEAEVVLAEIQFRPRRQLVCRMQDESGGELWLRFLNFYPSFTRQLQPGKRVRLFGEVRSGFFGAEMVHPRFHVVEPGDSLPDALTPVYPTTAGLSQTGLRKLVDMALKQADLTETLPPALLHRLSLPGFEESVRLLHHPGPEYSASSLEDRNLPAWQRLKFDELLAQQMQLRLAYAARRAKGAPPLLPHAILTDKLLEALPFRLTRAQERAWGEIASDLTAQHPMQRLLQGDVGSGKTIVAALAMLRAVENGWQAALMAPTEILAEQHYRKLASWLEALNLPVAWLSGSQKKSERKKVLAAIASGEISLVVGTHALIEDGVDFPRLALAIVDEQHRFGVRQRLALRNKGGAEEGARDGEARPHQLMMSATPIPRTLAMSYYADLDVSVLDELPPGRTPVLTKLVSDGRRDEVVARIRFACAEGRQAYWVCPLIEESEALDRKSVV